MSSISDYNISVLKCISMPESFNLKFSGFLRKCLNFLLAIFNLYRGERKVERCFVG